MATVVVNGPPGAMSKLDPKTSAPSLGISGKPVKMRSQK
jgi:hypothetical protein